MAKILSCILILILSLFVGEQALAQYYYGVRQPYNYYQQPYTGYYYRGGGYQPNYQTYGRYYYPQYYGGSWRACHYGSHGSHAIRGCRWGSHGSHVASSGEG